jgi:hypothetical protein
MALVEGKEVKVGDFVGFKSDIEQYGEITAIKGNTLTLYHPDGFDGEYIGGENYYIVDCRNCWLD